MRIFEYNAIYEGQSFIYSSLIANKQLLAVFVDGVGMDKILYSGSPTNKEVKFIPGLISFPFTPKGIFFGTPLTRGIYILILYQ